MAYTNSPQFSTYKTVPIAVDGRSFYRNGDTTTGRDLQLVNMYYDVATQNEQSQQDTKRLVKRPGLKDTTYTLSKNASSDVLRGNFYDTDQNALYWAVNNKVYALKPDTSSTPRTVCTLNTSSGLVGFCAYLDDSNDRYIIISDGTDLWVDNWAITTCTRVTDADLPTPHEPCPLYINGYVFLIKADTGDIYNSDLNDPTAWTSGDFLTAEINSDYLLRLVKSRNYIIALGYNSIEYFYDAGNASGSPLNRNDSPFRNIGYISNLTTIADAVYFIGQDEKHNIGVYTIDGFDVKRISTPVVDRTLAPLATTDNIKSRAVLDKYGQCLSINGHTFYVVPTTTTTWVYDITLKEWYEWKNVSGSGLSIQASWQMYNGALYVATDNRNVLSLMSHELYQDFSTNFICSYTSELIDLGTLNWKYISKFILDCSQEASSGTSNVTLTWSDNDWKSVANASRAINIFSLSPQIHRLGRFRKRSFKLSYTDNYPFWLRGFYLGVNVGQN